MKTNIIVSLLTLASLLSCSQYKAEAPASDAEVARLAASTDDLVNLQASNSAAMANAPDHDPYAGPNVKLIKTADYRFEASNVKTTTDAIEAAIRKYPSYISASNLTLEYTLLEQKMSIRVQSDSFYDLLKEIDAQALHVQRREITTQDVSKDFVDLESRLKTKREVETRYTEILRTKAGKIEELLEAEAKIGELHEEIEATISRMNYLKSQVSYSTINLEYFQHVTETVAASDAHTTLGEFSTALSTGWQGVVGVLIALTYLWPVLVLTGGAYLLYFMRYKKLRLGAENAKLKT
jgi:Domain of unknown function (DUF4349)